MQINHITRRPYERGNLATLENEQRAKGYTSNEWLTFVQAKKCGRVIKKGTHGIKLGRVLEETDEKNEKKRGYKRFVVFNLDQTESALQRYGCRELQANTPV